MFLSNGIAWAGGVQTPEKMLPAVIVEASGNDSIGIADSASQGTVSGKQIENRPLSRTAEILEVVPGMIVTQHSGDGKANQYYVRGFNLDHGTDFRTTVLGMPVNMPSHAHGQGYADLNFLIPELVKSIQYKKGPYYAEEGDFSAAGVAAIDYVRSLPAGIASIELGSHRYRRAVLANSTNLGPGKLLYALEGTSQDGPWKLPEDFKRFNGVLSYSWKDGRDDFRITGMALDSAWTSTDQIPRRAVEDGRIDRFGFVDPSDGGDTARQSLSADWTRRYSDGMFKLNTYLIRSRLDLYSNFTYFLDDPVNGDQFQQSERRHVAGLGADRTWLHKLAGYESETTAGVQLRGDRLDPVGLYTTVAQQRLATTREDRITELASALFVANTTRWTSWFRSTVGLRADRYHFDVESDNPANSGKEDDTIVSPKLSAVFSPAENTEVYVNWGRGFHSNDARGVTQTVDPGTGLNVDADGNPVTKATPLVKASGKEIGVRHTGLIPGLQTSLTLWQLDLDSELVFVGDAGTTEAGRPSRRAGIEFANYYSPVPGWIIDADFAWSRSRFTDSRPEGNAIPGSIARTASIGASMEEGKWTAGLRLRYFGSRPLIEDKSVRSASSTLVNAKLGYALAKNLKLSAELLNLFDREVSDIDYFYESRLPGETAPVADIHAHPAEPRALRVALVFNF